MPSPVKPYAAPIPVDTALSAAIDIADMVLCGVYLPSTFDGTTLGFTACDTATGTFLTVRDGRNGAAVSYTVAASSYVALDPALFAGIRYIKLAPGTTQTTTSTAAVLSTRPL